jgi:hypothetical protein
MKFRQSILLLVVLTLIAALVGCSSSSSSTPPPAISVTISGAPSSLQTNGTAMLTATVSNDPKNGGVTWSVSCGLSGTNVCGSFSSITTPSGTATTYTAPASATTVMVTATAADSSSAMATASITITAPAISVAFNPAPPTSLIVSQQTPLTAVVSNDTGTGGVNWSCMPTGACGSFSAPNTASGSPVTYTAPSSVPAGGSVTITATAADSSSATAMANITITTTAPISIAFSGPVPTSLNLNQQTSLTAVVSNDPQNGGVNWSCTPAGTCGSFSAATTGSGVATTYTAPASITTVTITATAADSSSAKVTDTFNITTAPLAQGNYVFFVSGTYGGTGVPLPYSVAGVFSVDGTGTVTGGEQDFNNSATIETDLINPTGSKVVATADGNLLITLVTCNGNTQADCTGANGTDTGVGVNGTETFNGSLYCTCKAALTEFDLNSSGSGTLDLQTQPVAAPQYGYAFAIAGAVPDQSTGGDVPFALGGILDFNGTGGLTTAGSVFDVNDKAQSAPLADQSFTSGTVGTADNLGRVDITLTPSASSGLPAITLAGYIVDNTRIRLVEENDSLGAITGGSALGQGQQNTGGFTSFSGQSYVVGLAGIDGNGPLQAAGVLNAGAVSISGWVNYNDLSGTGVQTPISITGNSYTVDPTGRVTMTGLRGGAGSNLTVNLQLYLTGEGHALAITLDKTDVLAGLGFAQNGKGAYSEASFNGTYALNAFGVAGGDEFDEVGPVTADGKGALTGFVDTNWLFNAGPVADSTVTGSYPTPIFDTTLGVFTGTTTGLDVTNPTTSNDAFTYYVVGTTNSSVVVGIETDTNQLTLDYFELQQF